MSRMPEFDLETCNPEQREAYLAIASGPRGIVEGPLKVWLSSPRLAEEAQTLGAFCRYGTDLHPRLSELAILVTGAHWKAEFEWHIHAPIAIQAGISQDVADAIQKGRTPQFEDLEEELVYRFTSELLTNRQVSDSTFLDARRQLGSKCLVELVGVLGYYSLISMTINAFEVPLPDGAPFAFQASDDV